MPNLKKEARRIYEQSDVTAVSLSRLTGVPRTTIQSWIKRENWIRYTDKNAAKNQGDPAGPISHETAEQTVVLLFRLRNLARQHIQNLEEDIDLRTATGSAIERGRNVHALRNLIKIIEEISDLEDRLEQSVNDEEKLQFNDKIRLEIAQRIEALRGKN